jgi:hypothetical protein
MHLHYLQRHSTINFPFTEIPYWIMTMRMKYKQITGSETPPILQQGAAIVDIRRPEEWQLTGTVADSILLTFFDAEGNSDPAGWLQQLNQQVVNDIPLVLI